MGGFILGFDTDTDDVFDRQLEFIRRNGIPQSMVGLLAAMPNTDLFKRLEREGRIIENDNPHSGDNVDTVLNFVPVMPAEKLVEGYRRVIAETYAPKNYFARALKVISRFPDLKITKLRQAEPWKKKLAEAKLTNHPNKMRLTRELAKLSLFRVRCSCVMVYYQGVEVRIACPAHCDRAGFPGTPLCKCCRENRAHETAASARGKRGQT